MKNRTIKKSLMIILVICIMSMTFAYSSLSEALAITSNVKFRTYADIN